MNGKQAKKLRRLAGVTTAYGNGMDKKEHKKVKSADSVLFSRYKLVLNNASWAYYNKLKKEFRKEAAT